MNNMEHLQKIRNHHINADRIKLFIETYSELKNALEKPGLESYENIQERVQQNFNRRIGTIALEDNVAIHRVLYITNLIETIIEFLRDYEYVKRSDKRKIRVDIIKGRVMTDDRTLKRILLEYDDIFYENTKYVRYLDRDLLIVMDRVRHEFIRILNENIDYNTQMLRRAKYINPK